MRVRIELDLALSPAQKRVARWGVVGGVAIGAIGLGVAFAGLPTDTSWIGPGKPVVAAALAQNVSDLQGQFYDPACPYGYTQETADAGAGIVVCQNHGPDAGAVRVDEVVKVGTKWSAFWIDRYEASVWAAPYGSGMQYGGTNPDGSMAYPYPSTFPRNGQYTDVGDIPLYAASVFDVPPSASLTWYQAMQACALSGKRLPTGEEWLRAATGTPDPTVPSAGEGSCVTQTPRGPQATGENRGCVSAWGAFDMIGNVAEWTSEWFATLPVTDAGGVSGTWPNVGGLNPYNSDGTTNIASFATSDDLFTYSPHIPAAVTRGGGWSGGLTSGIFDVSAQLAPTSWGTNNGFRCVIPR